MKPSCRIGRAGNAGNIIMLLDGSYGFVPVQRGPPVLEPGFFLGYFRGGGNVGREKRAIIAGIAGQDGSYLAELLLSKGYRVLGFLKKEDDRSPLAGIGGDIDLEETELVRKEDIARWT